MIFTFYRISNKAFDDRDLMFCHSAKVSHANAQIHLHSEWFDRYIISPQVADVNEVNVFNFVFGDEKSRIEYINNPFTMHSRRDVVDNITKYPMAKIYANNSIYDVALCYEQFKKPWSYTYYELTADNHHYRIYDSNHGRNGRFFCIYLDDILVAIAVFDYHGRSAGATYTVYSEDDIDTRILAVLLMYNDIMLVIQDSSQCPPIAIIPKPLKEKYNPDFLNKIAEREEKKNHTKWIDGIDFA